jgi:hypothetical protein
MFCLPHGICCILFFSNKVPAKQKPARMVDVNYSALLDTPTSPTSYVEYLSAGKLRPQSNQSSAEALSALLAFYFSWANDTLYGG